MKNIDFSVSKSQNNLVFIRKPNRKFVDLSSDNIANNRRSIVNQSVKIPDISVIDKNSLKYITIDEVDAKIKLTTPQNANKDQKINESFKKYITKPAQGINYKE